jgi:hypothetical protein
LQGNNLVRGSNLRSPFTLLASINSNDYYSSDEVAPNHRAATGVTARFARARGFIDLCSPDRFLYGPISCRHRHADYFGRDRILSCRLLYVQIPPDAGSTWSRAHATCVDRAVLNHSEPDVFGAIAIFDRLPGRRGIDLVRYPSDSLLFDNEFPADPI